MSLSLRTSVRMNCTNKRNIDKLIKGNKNLKSTFRSKKAYKNTHRVALDELDTFLELVDDAMDALNDTKVDIEKTQAKLYKLYDFCGEVPFDDSCDY